MGQQPGAGGSHARGRRALQDRSARTPGGE
jgi:hypothetical protein